MRHILCIILLLTKLSSCAKESPTFIEQQADNSVRVIHSPQRKPREASPLPFGSSIFQCLPNMPEPLTVDPAETFERYTHLGDGFDHARKVFMQEATPLADALTFDRWGDGEFESELITNSLTSRPSFNILAVNRFNAYEGRGLYVAESPISSVAYMLRHYDKHATTHNWNLPMLITVKVPRGTLAISYAQREDLLKKSLDPTYSSFIQSDLTAQRKYLPAPILIHYKSIPGRVPVTIDPYLVGPNNNIETPIGLDWRVIKSAHNLEVKEFDGQEASTKKLLEYDRVFRQFVYKLKVPNAKKVYDYYQARVTPILSKRVFTPAHPESIPTPLTALYPAKDWGGISELKHCVGARIPNAKDDALHYYWRFDGSCGGYADQDATMLIVDPKSRRDEPGYRPHEDPDNAPCLKNFPSMSTWIWLDESSSFAWVDAIPIDGHSNAHAHQHDRGSYIIIGMAAPRSP